MMTGVTAAVFALALIPLAEASRPVGPVQVTPDAAAAITTQILKTRAESEASLRSSPTSYLATVRERTSATGRR